MTAAGPENGSPRPGALISGHLTAPSERSLGKEAKWAAYATTIVTIHLDETQPWSSEAEPWSGPETWIITAHNPFGQVQSRVLNQAATDRLAAILQQRGWPTWRAVGKSPDGTWSEDSFAVVAPGHDVLVLASLFDQDAIFRVVDNHVDVVTADGRTVSTRRLPDHHGPVHREDDGSGGVAK